MIRSGGQGYRLNEWITVVGDGGAVTGSRGPVNDPVSDPGDGPGNGPGNARRQWVLAELGKGTKLRVQAIAEVLRCSPTTAKRYFAHDLLSAWPGFIDEGVDLPPLHSRRPQGS